MTDSRSYSASGSVGTSREPENESERLTITFTPYPYWFVWCKTGYLPRRKHESAVSAEAEAMRLALKHPGTKFIVISGYTKFVAQPPTGNTVGTKT